MSYGGTTSTQGSGGRLDQPRPQLVSMHPLHTRGPVLRHWGKRSLQVKAGKKLLSHTLLLSRPQPATCLLCRLSTRDICGLSRPEHT